MKLDDFASNVTSQFGQDGMIGHIFDAIGEQSRVCVEFGASDGIDCSNTIVLRRAGWQSVLIEADEERFQRLRANTASDRSVVVPAAVAPEGIYSIDSILQDCGVTDVDFMSIDIDGNDYWIWEGMQVRPRTLCIEYNFTVPPHLHLVQPPGNAGFGASAAALVDLGERKGYAFIGRTHSDLFFVRSDEAAPFEGYERNLSDLFSADQFTYVVTDYHGRAGAAGAVPPFGIGDHLIEIDGIQAIGTNPERIVAAYESRFNCPVLYLTAENWFNIGDDQPTSLAFSQLAAYMDAGVPAICIDLSHVSHSDRGDVALRALKLAEPLYYSVSMLGDVLAVVLRRVMDNGHV